MPDQNATIRSPRSADRGLVRSVFDYAGAELDPFMDQGIGGRQLGSAIAALRLGMEGFTQALAPAGSGPDSFHRAMMLASTVLVADDAHGQAVGAVAVRPCIASATGAMDEHPSRATELGIKGLAGTAKIVALAVIPEKRSQGIGRLLLDATVEHYRQAGTPMIYGIIEDEKASKLTGFYENAGFHVLQPGHILDVSHVYGFKAYTRCDPGERYFYRDLQDPGSRRWEGPKLTYKSERESSSESMPQAASCQGKALATEPESPQKGGLLGWPKRRWP